MANRLTQEEQVRNSDTYSDTETTGSAMEAAENASNLQADMNNLRTMLRRHVNGAGSRNWYDDVLDGFGLDQIHDKALAIRMPFRQTGANPANFTLAGGPLAGVLTPASQYPGGAGTIAVGGGSTEDGGFQAADESNFTVAGTLGVGLSTVVDPNGAILNAVDLIDAATNAPPKTVDDEIIFGLLHVVTGTADGAAIGGAASENLQISFVYVDKSTDTITAATLPDGTYHYAPARLSTFYSLARGALLTPGGSIAEAGGTAPRLPFIEIEITGTKPAANDPFTITTGNFTTAGAQTVVSSDGTVALPSSGALKRFDEEFADLKGAILASSSFPIAFPPQKIGKQHYTDGGVRDIAPLKPAIEAGADEIVVIMTADPFTPVKSDLPGNAVSMAMRVVDLLTTEVLFNDIQKCQEVNSRLQHYPAQYVGKRRISIRYFWPSKELTDSLDFDRKTMKKQIQQGYEETKKRLGI